MRTRCAQSEAEMSEPSRTAPPRRTDVRIGSSTNALQPISGVERSRHAGSAQWLALLMIAGAAILADQLTKALVSRRLPIGEVVAAIGPFSIHHIQNTGIAFGLFANSTTAVIVLTGVAVGAMLLVFSRTARRHPLVPVALGLVIGGSIANLLDRVRLGHVTDFLDFAYWPAFNLADTFIVVGVGLLFASFVAADRASARVGTAPLSRS
ncbi:MAG: signal peptidase II [Thermoleophilia bacterium]|nr:signal peptidase II [Thermoleophilia bacterium]